jgi:hypothetical protein
VLVGTRNGGPMMFFFSVPIGIAIAIWLGYMLVSAVIADSLPLCPECKSKANRGASRCCHCGSLLPDLPPRKLFAARTPVEKILMFLLILLGIPFLLGAIVAIAANIM